MKDERGNVIALVLLVLGVVSLVGAGALLMSRYDLKFTAAMKSYDKGFNLADGGATISYRDLSKRDREQSLTSATGDQSAITSTYKSNPPAAKTIYCQCQNPSECFSTPVTCPSGRCVDKSAGDYTVQVQIIDFNTASTGEPGWEAGSYYRTYWNGQGLAARGQTAAGTTGSTWNITNSTVQTNVQKVQQTGK